MFQNLKIRNKLVLIMVSTGMSVLLLAIVALLATEYSRTRQSVLGELQTLTKVLDWEVAAALVFDDQKTAKQTLTALAAKPSIVAAYLYDTEGEVFASYEASMVGARQETRTENYLPPHLAVAPLGKNGSLAESRDGNQHVLRQVKFDNEVVGMLQIVDDQSDLHRMVRGMYLVTLLIVVVALGLIIIISARLQRIFSDPVHKLITAMKDVAKSQDYSARVENLSADEFGVLGEAYNKMLSEIQDRDIRLAGHGQKMELQVAERTAQLSSAVSDLKSITREAVEAKEAAEEASRAKSEFLATMSHEIRTPMNGVLGMAELLASSKLTTRQAHFAQTIQSSGQALLQVINDILDFSKIESSMLRLDTHSFHLGDLMEDIADLMFEQAAQKGLEISLDLPTQTRTQLWGDSHRLRQVVVNLVGNAIKFTDSGQILIRVVPGRDVPGHLAFTCEISDTGIGIEQTVQDRIFEAFTQADGSTTRKFGGTGLGLAISRQLVELMGGSIGVRSTIGQGTTFWVELELPCDETIHADESPHSVALSGRNLLLVDDTNLNLEILREFATSWDMGSAGVQDYDEAMAALASGTADGGTWDAVVLDLHLPGTNGIDLAQAIRQLKGYETTPLIMLSSTCHDLDLKAALAVGIDSYLHKPVRKKDLGDKLADLLQDDTTQPVDQSSDRQTSDLQAVFTGRVLVGEDNPVNQEVARGLLELLGLEVVVAEDGEQAVAAFAKEKFEIIFMDCHMPGMDGFEAATHIRTLEQRAGAASSPRTPIIALTANVQKEVQAQCLSAGMDGYLSKPFTADRLIDTLKQWLPESCLRAPDENAISAVAPAEPATTIAEQAGLPILDETILGQLKVLQRPGRPDILLTAIEKYFINFEDKCHKIVAAIEAADAAQLADAAHFLKSGSASLGAMAMSDICANLEQFGLGGDMAAAADLMENFISISTRTRQSLETHARGRSVVTN